MVFRRRRERAERAAEEVAEPGARPGAGPAADRQAEPSAGEDARTGPWDEADLPAPRDGRIDLGALLVPAVQGLQIGLERADNHIVGVRLQVGDSVLQLVPLAAPRTSGIWDDVRAEIGADVAKRGGTVNEAVGAFGPELIASLPTRARDGKRGTQRVRFVGVDGPRWLLRGVISGRAATDSHQAELLERIFRDVVVVRGKEPIPPRDLIPLRLPPGGRAEAPPEGADSTAG